MDDRTGSNVLQDSNIAGMLNWATSQSGLTQSEIARRSRLHRDALRRTLTGKRAVSVHETLRILSACGAAPRAHLQMAINGQNELVRDWMFSRHATFLDAFLTEFPIALDNILGERLFDLDPRWAKGSARRFALLLSDHVEELKRRDSLLVE